MSFILFSQLETDESLLIPKARTSLIRYGHQAVVANELHKRKHEVCLVESQLRHAGQDGDSSDFKETWIKLEQSSLPHQSAVQPEIEELIIRELVQRHESWMVKGTSR